MEIFLKIILLIEFLFTTIIVFTSNDKVAKVCFEILKGTVVALFTFSVCNLIITNSPQAIDVYRGITTLEITYKDSIPVDSVVVFK